MLLLLLACHATDPAPIPVPTEPGTPPLGPSPLVAATIAPGDPAAPASALATYTFARPVAVDVVGTDGRHELVLHRDAAATHAIPLVGLYADASWTFSATASDAGGSWALPDLAWATPPLPTPFPHVALRVADPAAMAPGWTLLPLTSAGVAGHLAAFDAAGDVAWWYEVPTPRIIEAKPTSRGTILFMWDYKELREIDWLGHTVRSVTSRLAGDAQTVPVDSDQFHHELFEDADGRWITMQTEIFRRDLYPVSYDDRLELAPADVRHEPILAIDPDSGEIVDRWRPHDVLDPGRIGYDSLDVFVDAYDWNHSNAVADTGDAFLVSLRHQDAVVKIDKGDGLLGWILGNPANWAPAWEALRLQPVGDVVWPYHQHAVKWSPDGRVLLFDNRNASASPWTGELLTPERDIRSRIVEYRVDEAARTVEQTFAFELAPHVFSQAMGDADWLPNDSFLACFAYVTFEDGEPITVFDRGQPSIRVVEVQRDGTVVFDLDIWGELADEAEDWHAYRAERVLPPR